MGIIFENWCFVISELANLFFSNYTRDINQSFVIVLLLQRFLDSFILLGLKIKKNSANEVSKGKIYKKEKVMIDLFKPSFLLKIKFLSFVKFYFIVKWEAS